MSLHFAICPDSGEALDSLRAAGRQFADTCEMTSPLWPATAGKGGTASIRAASPQTTPCPPRTVEPPPAGMVLTRATQASVQLLSPWLGGAVFAGWAIALVAAGTLRTISKHIT